MLIILFKPVVFLVFCGFFLTALLLFAEKKILNYGICKITINNGKKIFNVLGGSSLLSLLTENNLFIPSACGGSGTCGYCKVKMISGGEFISPIDKVHLLNDEINSGTRLSCQVKIRKDVEIKIPNELLFVRRYKAVVLRKKKLTYDIVSVTLKILEPSSIIFDAGQYIQIESEGYEGRDKVIRAYSISSSPSNNSEISVIVRKVKDGVCSSWIFSYLQEGSELFFSGPYGKFILSKNKSSLIFVAGGSGMAPIWSILQYMIENKINRKTIYIFGALTQEDLFYKSRLEKLSDKLEWFEFIPILSNESEKSGWLGKRGLVTDLLDSYEANIANYEAYLCGSPGMISACISTLVRNGMLETNIYYDNFT